MLVKTDSKETMTTTFGCVRQSTAPETEEPTGFDKTGPKPYELSCRSKEPATSLGQGKARGPDTGSGRADRAEQEPRGVAAARGPRRPGARLELVAASGGSRITSGPGSREPRPRREARRLLRTRLPRTRNHPRGKT